ncbi:MAG: S1C family serine protease [Christensenellaceae bacterium]|jgi:serine protease Do
MNDYRDGNSFGQPPQEPQQEQPYRGQPQEPYQPQYQPQQQQYHYHAPQGPQQSRQVYGQIGGTNNQNTQHSQSRQPKKKKGGIFGVVMAATIAGVLIGSAITGLVIVPVAMNGATANAQLEIPTEQPVAELPQYDVAEPEESETVSPGAEEAEDSSPADQDELDNPVVAVAEDVSESVVGVATYNKELVPGQEAIEQAISAGSGFVISEEGYILTNNHVVSGGNLIRIITHDGTEYTAQLVGKDKDSDLAVLKVEGANLKPVKIGDSNATKVGEMAIAIGNPLGQTLSNTVTVGYVSALSREVLLDGVPTEMMQTDAAINPGNSGGPLVNANGEVIGITTQKSIFAGVDVYGNAIPSEGIGFAIPISNAMELVDQLIEFGGIEKPGIGISYSPISEEDAELWQTPRGALIMDVVAGSPAFLAGIRANDIIIEFEGIDLTDGSEIPTLTDRSVGETITAKVWREGTVYDVEMSIADLNQLS